MLPMWRAALIWMLGARNHKPTILLPTVGSKMVG